MIDPWDRWKETVSVPQMNCFDRLPLAVQRAINNSAIDINAEQCFVDMQHSGRGERFVLQMIARQQPPKAVKIRIGDRP